MSLDNKELRLSLLYSQTTYPSRKDSKNFAIKIQQGLPSNFQ